MSGLLHGIEVPLGNGKKVRIVVEQVIGAFAIHMRIWGERPVGPGYSVTYIDGGIAMWTVAELRDAVRVAQWLDKMKIFPADVQKMSGQDRADLVKKLTAIAPRYQYGP